MKKNKIKNYEGLVELAGSKAAIAVVVKVDAFTVHRWRERGIPKKYWFDLMDEYEITREELEAINKGTPNE